MAARVPLGNGQVETAKSPGQFVLTVYAPVPDVRIKATPDLKTRGDGVLLFVDLGEGPPVLGGSALSQVFGQLGFGRSPKVDSKALKAWRMGSQDVTYHCPQSSSWRQIGRGRSSRCANMAMFEREPLPGVTQISSGTSDAEDARVLCAAFAEVAAEASEIERTAIELDRAGDIEQAMAVYRQAAERMAKAAALCPEGNPDRAMLAKHAGEIFGRVVYLESLQGALATVPPEAHIGCDSLVLGHGVERQDSDGFQVLCHPSESGYGRSEPNWRQKAVSAAAVSGLKWRVEFGVICGAAGLLVLHAPVCALGLAAGAAYATTRQDSAGEAARSMGSMGLQAAEHVKHVAEQHRLPERASDAMSGVRSLDQRWRVSERTQALASSSVTSLREIDQRHQVTATVASGAKRASLKLGEMVTPAASWVVRRFRG
eukprot:symbB.v1.2.034475.t1/scaffold4453.1/size39496/2